MLLAIFSPQKLTRFNIASFLCRFIPNRMKEEHGHVMASMSYLQGGTNLGWKKKTYLRCSMLVVNAVGKSCSVPVYQFSYSIQWICWFQDHLKQDEGPARPCNGFYVLFCLCRTIGTIRTTWDGKKIFLKMFHVSGEFSEWNHVPFTCLIFSYSIQRICWFQHPLKRVSAGSCTAGSTGCWQYRSTIKIGIEKRGPL